MRSPRVRAICSTARSTADSIPSPSRSIFRNPASAHESLSHMAICRPSIAAGTIGQQSISGRVAMIIPPECWDRWRGRPWASAASRASHAHRPLRWVGPFRALDVPAHLPGVPPLAAAGHPLDLPRRQPQRLAELADRPAGAVGGEGGDQRRALVPVALVDARDELLPDVPREVEVDVRQRGQLVVEEPADQQLVGDRIDVREPGQEADDRRDAGAPAPPRRQQRPGAVRARAPRRPPRGPAPAGRGAAGRTRAGPATR